MMLLMSPLRSARSMWGEEAAALTGRSTAAARKKSQPNRSATTPRMPRVWRAVPCKTWNVGYRWVFLAGVESDAMGAESVQPNADEDVMRDFRRQARSVAHLDAREQQNLLERSAAGDR